VQAVTKLNFFGNFFDRSTDTDNNPEKQHGNSAGKESVGEKDVQEKN
jgi:hypothetical protein